MKEYLLLFRNPAGEKGYLASSQEMAAAMPAWQSWIGHIALQGKLVATAPIEFGIETYQANGFQPGPYRQSDQIIVSGFLLCKTDKLEEVKEWSQTCPILQYPHSSVEIRPLIPFPVN